MKKIGNAMYGLFGLFGAFALAGCQNETLPADGVAADGEGNVMFTLSAPEAMETSRATLGSNSNSALGGLSNVDYSQYDLRYQLAVYRVDDTGASATYTQVVAPQVKIVADGYEPVTYNLRLTPNRNYRAVAWADFVREGQTDDLYYDTSDFTDIHQADLPLQYVINEESKDAYFGSTDVTVSNTDVPAISFELKRPFAKLRIVTTDWNYGDLGEEMPDKVEVTYYNCKRFLALNALTGEATSTDLAETDGTVYTASLNKDEKAYALGYDASKNNRTIMVDYLMTDKSDETPIHMKMTAKNGETEIATQELKTNIPIKRNWLTTIIGNALTVGSEFKITIDDDFTNEWVEGQCWWNPAVITPTKPEYDEATKTYRIRTADEFAWISENAGKAAAEGGISLTGCTLSIENDIDMSGTNWKPIYEAGEPVHTVLGNGHTLRNFTIDNKFGFANHKIDRPIIGGQWTVNIYTGVWGNYNGTMRNLNFENISINGLADSETHVDENGDIVDHSNEDAWFAGCLGYVGANYSTPATIENVHVKHIHVEASGNNGLPSVSSQNVGGLIGWIGVGGGSKPNETTQVRNCSAEDVNITGYQSGGLVGEVKGGRGVGFTNCWAEDVTIRIASMIFQDNAVSGFIGNIEGGNSVRITDCQAATNLQLLDLNGNPSSYTPANALYGDCENGTPVIESTTTTEP